ncbi:MAG: restriction endonuclease subunit S [Coleofasciculus sp. G1-WW12-02]|uniref:restriction endonuclease subunit S n=1 Tax=Coleofasciculus sp. G1-WW12-02 TaxID=3068483 RepID=UPI0032FDB98C
MGKYQGYERYKDSGVEWLGEIPESWEIVRFSHFITFQEGPGIMAADFRDEGIPLLRIHNLKPGFVDLEGCNYLDPEKVEKTWKHFKLKRNDILISCSASTGLISIVDEKSENSIAYTGIIRLNPARCEINRQFIQVLVGSDLFFTQIDLLKTGTTIQHYGPVHLRQIKITLPPLEEQKTIAQFIDHKTSQIDALISKKEALLEKLDEKRTALISHAVTKGLDPTVPMKDSGIEWLGDIPAHWRVVRQRFLVSMQGGSTPSKSNPEFWDGEIPWISPKDMKKERLTSSIDKITNEALKETSIHLHSQGSVLIVVRGMILAHSFPVAINDVDVTINQDMKILKTVLNPEYLAILLRGIKNLILSIVEESAHGTKVLRTDLYKNIRLPVPPLNEQEEVVNKIEKITTSSDQMSRTIETAIDLLKEYRTALITNAVTGKIDVRQVPIPQP